MRIIPALDIIDGRCVRLEQGNYSRKKIYEKNPVEYAKELENQGFQYLHLVDLDGAKMGNLTQWGILEKICNTTQLKVDFGGGIKNTDALKLAFNCGARQVTAGSIAAQNPEIVGTWLERFGTDKIILGTDVKDKEIYINGWKTNTKLALFPFLQKFVALGIQTVICTDISRDGLLQGSAVSLYREIIDAFPGLKLIASGGVHNMEDLELLKNAGLKGAIVGKALLENKIDLKQLNFYAD